MMHLDLAADMIRLEQARRLRDAARPRPARAPRATRRVAASLQDDLRRIPIPCPCGADG